MNLQNNIISRIQATSKELFACLELLQQQCSSSNSIIRDQALIELDVYKVMSMKQLASKLHLEAHAASRLAHQLISEGLCVIQLHKDDRRNKLLYLTPQGIAFVKKIRATSHLHLQQALKNISKEEVDIIDQGLSLYTQILKSSCLQESYKIRKLLKKDLPHLDNLFAHVKTEYGLEHNHPTTPMLRCFLQERQGTRTYTLPKSRYLVMELKKEIVGGIGYRPLAESYPDTCVIRGFYLSSQVRGQGLGKKLLQKMMRSAKQAGFKQCYLELFECVQNPSAFYEKLGFKQLDKPLIKADYTVANRWYIKDI